MPTLNIINFMIPSVHFPICVYASVCVYVCGVQEIYYVYILFLRFIYIYIFDMIL